MPSKKYSDREVLGIINGPNAEHQKYLFELAPKPMLFVNSVGVILQVNAAFCELLQYADIELVGKKISEITHPEDMADNELLFDRMRTGKCNSYIFLKRYLSKRDRGVPCLVYSYAIRDEENHLIYVIKNAIPIQNGLVDKVEQIKKLTESDDKTWKVKIFDYVTNNAIQIIFVLSTLVGGVLFLMNMNENILHNNRLNEKIIEQNEQRLEK